MRFEKGFLGKFGEHFSGTPLQPKAARVEPHTHTKRHAGNFLWSWQAEWLAGACTVRTYVAFHDILT